MTPGRIQERKTRDREARRARIIQAARTIAETEGWPSVTVRRLADEICYSQPVLYSHFTNRESILSAVAVQGFQELGAALAGARKRSRGRSPLSRVAAAYLSFAAKSPALYEVMFSLQIDVPFGAPATPPELRFAFAQVLELFPDTAPNQESLAEVFWANLHGIADLRRTGRLPAAHEKERIAVLLKTFGTLSSIGS